MTPDDLARLHATCFTLPRPWSAAEFAALLGGPGVFLLTAPGGFLLGRALAGEAELLTLAVDPTARRQGLGAGLVAEFLGESTRRGAGRAFLEVAEGNGAAVSLYLRAGFTQVGRRRGYFAAPGHRPHDALVMARDLPVS